MKLWDMPTAQAQWYDRLVALYSEPHRRYHNLQHLAECLREFDTVRHLIKDPRAVELALWFHGAIYDPRAHDNEERSAALARNCLAQATSDELFIESVAQGILATKHLANPDSGDMRILVDIDLSILGQPAKRFNEYEKAVREEYAWVPSEVFRSKRAEILEIFLRRPRLYATDWFFAKYEERARSNLTHSVAALRR